MALFSIVQSRGMTRGMPIFINIVDADLDKANGFRVPPGMAWYGQTKRVPGTISADKVRASTLRSAHAQRSLSTGNQRAEVQGRILAMN